MKDVPAIVLTSSTDSATKLKALELGATDFLAKPVDPSELVLRVRNTLAAKAYRDRLANFDLLTGLPNRRLFMDRLEWAIRHAERYSKSGAVLHVDLDRFKQINEALGPKVGDQLLQAAAERIGQSVRSIDTIARLGEAGSQPSLSRLAGDEFTILLPIIAHPENAAVVAKRVLDAIGTPFKVENQDLLVTCCIGIAVFPDDGQEANTVIRNSEAAMHHAKRGTKATYQFYSSELNARALQKLKLSNELRRALEGEELRLFYQPKLDVKTAALVGAEALVRWQHPERDLVAPGEFISLAEETGLIIPLGEWVLRAACKQIKEWGAAGYFVPRISVNVSSHQFRQDRLADTVRGALKDTGV
ncbi:MAG: GGDEF/EAL domain-containing response regulator, partial [Burkholderiales bacterium]